MLNDDETESKYFHKKFCTNTTEICKSLFLFQSTHFFFFSKHRFWWYFTWQACGAFINQIYLIGKWHYFNSWISRFKKYLTTFFKHTKIHKRTLMSIYLVRPVLLIFPSITLHLWMMFIVSIDSQFINETTNQRPK